MNEVGGNVSI